MTLFLRIVSYISQQYIFNSQIVSFYHAIMKKSQNC